MSASVHHIALYRGAPALRAEIDARSREICELLDQVSALCGQSAVEAARIEIDECAYCGSYLGVDGIRMETYRGLVCSACAAEGDGVSKCRGDGCKHWHLNSEEACHSEEA